MRQPEEGDEDLVLNSQDDALVYNPERLAELRRNILTWLGQLDSERRAQVEARIVRDERIPEELFRQSMLFRDAAIRAYLEVIGPYPDPE